MPSGSRSHTRRAVVVSVAAAVATLASLGGCGRGEDRPGQVTTETSGGADRGAKGGDD